MTFCPHRLSALLLAAAIGIAAMAQRSETNINQGWSFRFSHSVQKGVEQPVNLPHTWNAGDALSGKIDYKRGIGNYKRLLFIGNELIDKRIFLHFEGANSVTSLFVNHQFAGEHRGGYSSFVMEISRLVKFGEQNLIEIRVNNAEQLDVMPLVGDFNFYGGIYRDLHLLTTPAVCISPLNYASPGLRLSQSNVSRKSADVVAAVDIDNALPHSTKLQLSVAISDGNKVVASDSRIITVEAGEKPCHEFSFKIANPHLWDGRNDPFLYQVQASLSDLDGNTIDSVKQNLGLRFFHIDPDKGFFLNGKHLPLHGVCRHQERAEIGNALLPEHHEEDIALILEMGANAIRLSHYPHAPYFYDLLDRHGIIAWSEIPFVGPGGYDDTGFVASQEFMRNGADQLREMILQHGNHPSVVTWGIFNELLSRDKPEAYIAELNRLAHSLDPSRPTTAASNIDGDLNFITDLMAWNRYDGWYGSTPATLASWLDNMHAQHPKLRIAISEYGAGASIIHQQDSLQQSVPNSWWHPENWQTYYHIKNWEIISQRPFVWGSFIWNMFDFGAAHRTEGDRPGINDKGLVTHDRKVRKDAFYFYKSNWNTSEPTLYIADRRCTKRTSPQQVITVFCSEPKAELFINGKSMGKAAADNLHIIKWNVTLQPGQNSIEVKATHPHVSLSDRITVTL